MWNSKRIHRPLPGQYANFHLILGVWSHLLNHVVFLERSDTSLDNDDVFSNRKFVSTRSEQSVRREMDGENDVARVLSSSLLELNNEGFSKSINDVGLGDVEDTAGCYQVNRMR